MSQSLGTNQGVLNLIANGGFNLQEEGVPAFWQLINLSQTGSNSYSLNNRLELVMGANTVSSISQSFDEQDIPFDFSVPVRGGVIRGLASGYQVRGLNNLPRSQSFTVSFDAEVEQGSVNFVVKYSVLNGSALTIKEAAPQEIAIVSTNGSRRLVFAIPADTGLITGVTIEFETKVASTFYIDKVAVALGSFEFLEYPGDPFLQLVPENCIIMSLGRACPTGFTELGEGGLSPLPEWAEDEPNINAREGNYPRGGTELSGATKHTADTTNVTDGARDSVEFESAQGRLYSEFTDTPGNEGSDFAFTINTSNATVDDNVSHSHELNSAKHRPASVGLLFCKRL